MVLRIWHAALNPIHLGEYRRFEAERSLPMLHKQPGFLGVFFVRAARESAVSFTIWEDGGAVEALQSSPSYQQEARELAESGLLAGEPSVMILEVEGGDLRPEALMGALARTRRSGSSRPPAAGSHD